MSSLPRAKVVIVGRTNVGKSALFNRLVDKNQVLVSEQPGTTRDTNLGIVNWRGHHFLIYDSGGTNPLKNDAVALGSLKRLDQAIKQANVILLVIDGQTGLLDSDLALGKKLQRSHKKVVAVVNKIDSVKQRQLAAPQVLNFPTQLVSAKTGVGVGDLLDLIWPDLEKIEQPAPELRLAVIGQTNVGKSSLFNRLLNQERSLVLPTPHTTRDRQHHFMSYQNSLIELIDTAGVRRQQPKAPRLEALSAEQTLQILPEVDIILLLLDASQPFSWQDQALADVAKQTLRPVIIILNKADLVEANDRFAINKQVINYLPMLSYAARLWLSAKQGEGVKRLIPLARQVQINWQRQLSQAEIKQFCQYIKRLQPIKNLPLLSIEQTGIAPPSFRARFDTKAMLPRAIADWLEGKLRHSFGFTGTPLRVHLQTRTKK
ncbi:MAG: ribosome biogenesis GTPase Der [Candidatus Kerfeldbacteria bacterium]|nr:ribosome biogenesis GTPase Der [Candidatus Kerfeldbacteria bacterium]